LTRSSVIVFFSAAFILLCMSCSSDPAVPKSAEPQPSKISSPNTPTTAATPTRTLSSTSQVDGKNLATLAKAPTSVANGIGEDSLRYATPTDLAGPPSQFALPAAAQPYLGSSPPPIIYGPIIKAEIAPQKPPEDLPLWLKEAGLLFAPVVALVIGIAAFVTARNNWKAARVKILIDCHKAYGDIYLGLIDMAERRRLLGPHLPTSDVEDRKLFARLWNLRYEQYFYYLEGQIPRPVFKGWVMYRYIDYRDQTFASFPVNHASTWEERRVEYGSRSELVEFMDEAMDVSNAKAETFSLTPEQVASNAERTVERVLREHLRTRKPWI
jgi:hypothetical protein